MLRISNELASGVAGMPPPDSDVEPIVGNIMDQFIDVFMRPYRYEILECHGVRWSRLFGQLFRFDEWSLCRG